MTTKTLHRRIEARTGLMFGTYRAKGSKYAVWPLFIGPISTKGIPKTYWQMWKIASGAEVCIYGRCAYVAKG